MFDKQKIFEIARQRSKENEKTYETLKKKINKIEDFQIFSDRIRKLKNEEQAFAETTNSLEELYDIKKRLPLDTKWGKPLRPLVLKIRKNLQNEIRSSLDPIVHKQVRFNAELCQVLKKIVEQTNIDFEQQQYLMESISKILSEHHQIVNSLFEKIDNSNKKIDDLTNSVNELIKENRKNTVSEE